jgi:hypothetical protein
MTLGLIGGGTVAGAVHALKGTARLASTATTGGLANPLLSLVDDVVATAGTVLAFVVPLLAVLLLLVLAALGIWIYRRRRVSAAPPPSLT